MRSESAAWREVQEIARQLSASSNPMTANAGLRLEQLTRLMRAQLVDGVHRNPLVIYGNPPRSVAERLSRRVYAVQYRHDADDQNYTHEFGPGVEMHAMSDGSVRLTHHKRTPLHEEFP